MWIADSSLNHDIHLKFDFIQWFMKYDLLTAGSQHLDELTIDLNSLWWDRVKSYHLNMKTDLYYK